LRTFTSATANWKDAHCWRFRQEMLKMHVRVFFAFCAFCVHSRIRFLPKRHRFRCANVCLFNVFAVWFYKCRSRRCAQRRKLGNGHVSTLVASRAPSLSTSSLRTGIAVSRACSLACVRFQLSTPCHTHATPCSTLQCVAV